MWNTNSLVSAAIYGHVANNTSWSKVHFKIKTVSEGVQAPDFHQLCSVIQVQETLPWVENIRC